MLTERKRVLFRYFNYIITDNKDKEQAMKDAEDEREREAKMADKRKQREYMMEEAGKHG